MSLRMPPFELYEEGSQIRRSSKSVASLMIEGYRLRKSRDEFLHYLHRAAASADETVEHLDFLHETKSLKDDLEYSRLHVDCEKLLAMLTTFIHGVQRNHEKPYSLSRPPALTERHQKPLVLPRPMAQNPRPPQTPGP